MSDSQKVDADTTAANGNGEVAAKDPEPLPPQKAAPAEKSSGLTSQLEDKIIRQVEYYFGDRNLPRDKFLQSAAAENEGGSGVPIATLLTFNRLKALSSDSEVIVRALRKTTSGVLEVNNEGDSVRRSPDNPPPDIFSAEQRQKMKEKTVYVTSCMEKTNPLDCDVILKIEVQHKKSVPTRLLDNVYRCQELLLSEHPCVQVMPVLCTHVVKPISLTSSRQMPYATDTPSLPRSSQAAISSTSEAAPSVAKCPMPEFIPKWDATPIKLAFPSSSVLATSLQATHPVRTPATAKPLLLQASSPPVQARAPAKPLLLQAKPPVQAGAPAKPLVAASSPEGMPTEDTHHLLQLNAPTEPLPLATAPSSEASLPVTSCGLPPTSLVPATYTEQSESPLPPSFHVPSNSWEQSDPPPPPSFHVPANSREQSDPPPPSSSHVPANSREISDPCLPLYSSVRATSLKRSDLPPPPPLIKVVCLTPPPEEVNCLPMSRPRWPGSGAHVVDVRNGCISVVPQKCNCPPVLGGTVMNPPCPHCLLGPCIVTKPPDWLWKSSELHVGTNSTKRRWLYSTFFHILGSLGVWSHPRYLTHKSMINIYGSGEVIPLCIVNAVRYRYPNPRNIPYSDATLYYLA